MFHLRQTAIVCLLVVVLLLLSVGCGGGVKLKDVHGYNASSLLDMDDGAIIAVTLVNNTGKRLNIKPADFKVFSKQGDTLDVKAIVGGPWGILLSKKEGTILRYYSDYAEAVVEPKGEFSLTFICLDVKDRYSIKHISFDNGTYRAVAKVK